MFCMLANTDFLFTTPIFIRNVQNSLLPLRTSRYVRKASKQTAFNRFIVIGIRSRTTTNDPRARTPSAQLNTAAIVFAFLEAYLFS